MVVSFGVATACSSSGGKSSTNPLSGSDSSANVAAAGGTSSAASGDASSAAAATGSPIKVGLICSCSGPYGANLTAAGDVAKAWVKSVNATGGIQGHPIDLTYVDDQSNPGTSVTVAQQVISKKVAVILDDSYLDATWSKAAAAAKIPVVGGVFNLADYISNPYFYPTGQTDDSIADSVAAIAKQSGAKKIASFYCAEAPTCAQVGDLVKAAGSKAGVPQVYSASVAATGANYTAQCLAAKQAGADAIFMPVSEQTAGRIGADCDRQGYDPTYLWEGTGYADSLTRYKGISKHLWVTFPILPYWANTPAIQKMNKAVDAAYPGLRQGKGGIWSEVAVQSWTAGLLIQDAVEKSGVAATGTIDSAAMLKGLNSVKDDTLEGWTGPLTFAAGQPHPQSCYFVANVLDGKTNLLNGGKPTCPTA